METTTGEEIMKIIRIEKGQQQPEVRGADSVYLIRHEDFPKKLISGKRYRIQIVGPVNLDDQGLFMDVDRITAQYLNMGERNDEVQEEIARQLKEDGEKPMKMASYLPKEAHLIVPQDDTPSGIMTGETYSIILEGTVDSTDQGTVIKLDRMFTERARR